MRIAEGLAKSLGHFDEFALFNCIAQEDQALIILTVDFEYIVEEAIRTKQYGELLVAAFFAVAGVEKLKEGWEGVCQDIFTDSLENQIKFASMNFSANIDKEVLIKDFTEILSAKKAGDYVAMGEALGNLFNDMKDNKASTPITGAKNNKPIMQKDAAKFMSGYLEGTGVGRFDPVILEECIYFVDEAA